MSKYIIEHDPVLGAFVILHKRWWFSPTRYVGTVHYPSKPTAGDLTDSLAQANGLVARFKDIDDRLNRR
jgi:hypothetical protein